MARAWTDGKRQVLCAILLGSLALAVPRPARAQAAEHAAKGRSTARTAPGLRWSKDFTHFTVTQYAATTGMAGLLFFGSDLYQGPKTSRWRQPILLDRGARLWLAADTAAARATASEISDYLVYALVAYPFLDAVLVAGAAHRNYEVAFQMGMISLQATLLQKVLSGITKNLVRRRRPDESRCAQGEGLSCAAPARSFFSGHTGTAFTGAALICAHHQNLSLYNHPAADRVACGVALGAAATVGGLRVVADRHHLSDVIAGALVGTFSGWLLPNLLNYDFGRSADVREAEDTAGYGTLAPLASDTLVGLQYLGTF